MGQAPWHARDALVPLFVRRQCFSFSASRVPPAAAGKSAPRHVTAARQPPLADRRMLPAESFSRVRA